MSRTLGIGKAGALAAAALFCTASPAAAKGGPTSGPVTWTSYERSFGFQDCSDGLAASTTCYVLGTADGSGRLSGLSRLASRVAGAPDEQAGAAANANAGGAVFVTHRVRQRTRSVVYSVTYEVVPYDDPTTATVEQAGLAISGENFYAGAIWADVFVNPGCSQQACMLHAELLLADSALDTVEAGDTLAVGETRTLEVTLAAPAGTSLPTGDTTVQASLDAVAAINQIPGSSAESSGAVRVTRITATPSS